MTLSDRTKPLSVRYLTASLSRDSGGLMPALIAQTKGLLDAGVDVAALGVEDANSAADSASWSPVGVRVFASKGPAAFAYAPGLWPAVKASGADVLHLHGLWMYPSVVAHRWSALGKPLVISPHGMLDPWALANSGAKKKLALALFERANLRAAACIHALNASEADSIRAFGLTNPIAVIPNGAALPEARAWPRSEWMAADRRVLLFLGRIHPKKGLSETLKAWALVHQRAPDLAARWQLALAGWDDGGHLEALRAEATALGLPDGAVVFPGPLFGDAKSAALANADAFILASHSEGLPMSVLEAWSHSLPVFMTRACNLPEGFEAGAAFEVTTDPEKLGLALVSRLDVVADGEMGGFGRALVERSFSWMAIAAAHEAVYRWLIDGGTPPACVRLD